MFRKTTNEITTNEIISTCNNAVTSYDESCNVFWSSPGQEGINRRIEFLLLLGNLNDASPEQAIFAIYKFYKKESCVNGMGMQHSRLVGNLERALYKLFNIKEKDYSCDNRREENYKYIIEMHRRRSELERCVQGFIENLNEISPVSSAIQMHNSL